MNLCFCKHASFGLTNNVFKPMTLETKIKVTEFSPDAIKILENLSLQLAYTFANYKYTSSKVDPVYTNTTYVLTEPPSSGQWLPNSPKHQLYSEIIYSCLSEFTCSIFVDEF